MTAENRKSTNRRKKGGQVDSLATKLKLIQRFHGKYRDKGLLKALIAERKRELDI